MKSPVIDNPVRGRFNAWFLDFLESYMHWKYAAIKPGLFSQLPQTVVELGPGAGANLRYLPKGTHLIAIEPNRYFHALLKRRAEQLGIVLEIHEVSGESLDLPSSSVDFIFTTLVLCSVSDPDKVLSEIRRVLKPGGRFVCIEHVLAPKNSIINSLQRIIAAPWKWLFEGCDLCRETGDSLKKAGFSDVKIDSIILPTAFFPIRHQIIATCSSQTGPLDC